MLKRLLTRNRPVGTGKAKRSASLWRYAEDQNAALGIEFTFLAPVFFLMCFAIFEISMIFVSTESMRSGLVDVARQVQTGQAQCMTDSRARSMICEDALLMNCSEDLDIEKEVFGANVTGGSVSVNSWTALAPGDIVLVRATYPYTIVNPMLTPYFSSNNSEKELSQSFVFKNEDFQTVSCN